MRQRIILALFSIILIGMGFIVWLSWRFFYQPLPIAEKSHLITIYPETNLSQLIRTLHQQNLLPDPLTFKIWAKWKGELNHLKPGQYRLESGLTAEGLWKKLRKGEVLLYKITFIEGWTFRQMMKALQSHAYLTHTLSNVEPDKIMAAIGYPGEHPEGMFYPDTYLFAEGTKDVTILKMAYHLMQQKLNQAWQNRAPHLPYQEPYQALIVASMIEKEAAVDKDRALIAGVILRRLEKQMRLQIDATVIYGLGQNYKGVLKRTDMTTDTPYNTYTRLGLPPTPIAIPRFASIEAALHPTNSHALYYVARGDGSHLFTDNLKAHQAATTKYLQPVLLRQQKNRQEAAQNFLRRLCISSSLLIHGWQRYRDSIQ